MRPEAVCQSITWIFAAGLCLACAACDRSESAVDPKQEGNASVTANGGLGGEAAKETPTSISSDQVISLVEHTSNWGVDATYVNGQSSGHYTILESLGGGVGLADFDRDGWCDLFVVGGGSFQGEQTVGLPSSLYRNIAGKRFTQVSDEASIGVVPRFYSHGAFVADYDADGFEDVLVSGYGGLQLWRNQGDGTFEEVSQASQLLEQAWSSGCAWADVNHDGLLDLYVAHYVNWSFDNHPFCRGRTADERDICPPREYEPLPDSLYLNRGDGSFEDVTEPWGLRPGGKGLAVIAADFDLNGQIDFYVANDTVNNFLYSNDGEAPLREVAMLSGSAADKAGIPNGSMGLGVLDFDGTGRPDIWVTNYEREDFALYRNEGPDAFLHVSDVAGLNVLGGLFVGFGTVCADFDLDGDEDIIVNNGHVILYPTASPRAQLPLVMSQHQGRFHRASYPAESYLSQPHEGRGLAIADLDNDGDPDAVFSNVNAPVAVLENQPNAGSNWLQVELVGTASNRNAIGASVILSAGETVQQRFVYGGGSYMSTSQSRIHFGLGELQSVDALEVRWPSGNRTRVEKPSANALLQIVEGRDD